MVKYSTQPLDLVFSALSDPTRRAILDRLTRGEATVTELARPFKMSLPAISKHLTVLERAGLITRAKDGRMHRCHLSADPMKEASEWIEKRYQEFWERQLDALADYFDSNDDKEEDA